MLACFSYLFKVALVILLKSLHFSNVFVTSQIVVLQASTSHPLFACSAMVVTHVFRTTSIYSTLGRLTSCQLAVSERESSGKKDPPLK